MNMYTDELIVLEKSEKDVECKDGKTRHYYNIKVGSPEYENITASVKEDVYNMIKEKDRAVFKGRYGGLAKPFWAYDKVVRLNGKTLEDNK